MAPALVYRSPKTERWVADDEVEQQVALAEKRIGKSMLI